MLLIALRDPRDVVISCFMQYLPLNTNSVCFLTLERTAKRFAHDMKLWLILREKICSPRIRTGVIGCGSVSGSYLPVLSKCPYVEVVSLCDIRPERARKRAEKFKVAHHYPHIDKMLAGEPFDFLITLTDMQEHEHLNRQALEAGKHVWSEKPIANSLAAGQELLRMARQKNDGCGARRSPCKVRSSRSWRARSRRARWDASPRRTRTTDTKGRTGLRSSTRRAAAACRTSMVYNLTSLTGLLGPAKHVTAMLSIVTPERDITEKGKIKVTEEDNAMVLLDHGKGVISHVQSGFNYFNPHGHDGSGEQRHTITIVGSGGFHGIGRLRLGAARRGPRDAQAAET